jgi:hypothetical protein
MAITSANQLELLQTAEAVAREKMIDPGLVVEAMEESLARAAKSRYGAEMDIRVKIDRKTGRATFTRVRTVVEDDAVENYQAQLTVAQARQHLADPKVGDEIVDEVPPVDLGRIAAQSAKQVILRRSARPSATGSTRSSRTASAPSSTPPSSARNTATSSWTWARARRSCAATTSSRARPTAPATASAPLSRTCAASRADPRSS